MGKGIICVHIIAYNEFPDELCELQTFHDVGIDVLFDPLLKRFS